MKLDALTVRVTTCVQSRGAIEEVTDLKADITELRKHVNQLKSIDMSMWFGTVEIPDKSDGDIQDCC